MSSQPYQNPRLASAYHDGNRLPAQSLRAWVGMIRSLGPVDRPLVLDVGTGTGMFATALADVPGSRLAVGVDPSQVMLAQAQRLNAHPRVSDLLK